MLIDEQKIGNMSPGMSAIKKMGSYVCALCWRNRASLLCLNNIMMSSFPLSAFPHYILLIYLNQILRSEIVELKAMDSLYMTLSKGWKWQSLSYVWLFETLWGLEPTRLLFYGPLQARRLEWVAIPYSRDLPNPGTEPRSSALQADSFTMWATREPILYITLSKSYIQLYTSIPMCVKESVLLHEGLYMKVHNHQRVATSKCPWWIDRQKCGLFIE